MLQNNDDLRVLNGITKKSLQRVTLTGGSGVDLRRFRFTPPRDCDPPTVLFAGRLLREKGIFELVDAVRLLRRSGHPLRLVVCGGIDAGNRSSVSKEQCEAWISEGVVDTIERVDDIRPFLQAAQLVVLPSYREGTPRSLLEAMATGRPLIATDVPGCREVVEPDVNGVLVPPQDVRALADAINYMLDCPQRLDAMGRASRTIAEQKFDERSVIEANLDVYRSLLPDRIPPSCLTEERDVKPTTPRLDEPAGSSIGAAPLAR